MKIVPAARLALRHGLCHIGRMTTPPSSTAHWPDLAGRISVENGVRTHTLPVRVYFEDTDFSGLVYHGSYVRWCERGRSDFLRLLGNDHKGLIDGGDGREPAAFIVRRLNLEYLKPARIDEVIEVKTRLKEMTAAAMILDQRVWRDGTELCRAEVMVVLVSQSGRVLRVGKTLRAAIGA